MVQRFCLHGYPLVVLPPRESLSALSQRKGMVWSFFEKHVRPVGKVGYVVGLRARLIMVAPPTQPPGSTHAGDKTAKDAQTSFEGSWPVEVLSILRTQLGRNSVWMLGGFGLRPAMRAVYFVIIARYSALLSTVLAARSEA